MSKFQVVSEYQPAGDQPEAIAALAAGIENGLDEQTLLGVTGSGKTFTMAKVIEAVQRPTLVLAHNKTLAAQLCAEFKEFFPNNAVEYFVSYYDYYQPEAYIPHTDTFIEKDSAVNEEIDRLRLAATASLMERRDVIVVSSVSCIYGLGEPEDFAKMMVSLRVGTQMEREELLKKLVSIRYERNDIAFERNMFRVRGDTVEIFPAYWKDSAIRVEFFGDEIDRISEINVVTGAAIRRLKTIPIWPATHYVTPKEKMDAAVQEIYKELEERVAFFQANNQLIEAQRIKQRTMYDVEMMQELGYCTGIENYSRVIEGRAPGSPPHTLLDYFPKDFVLFIDESHVTLPQVRAMYNGDKARKTSLVDYGFRLPCAFDNRPLKFDEFQKRLNQVVYVSATPGDYERERSGQIVEQVIRPTGLLDPKIEVRPVEGQIDDLIGEINTRTARSERVLVTTLTKEDGGGSHRLSDQRRHQGALHAPRHRHHRAHGDHPRPAPGYLRRAGGHQPAPRGPGSAGGVPGGHPGRRQGGLPPVGDLPYPDHRPGRPQRRRPGGHVRRLHHPLHAPGHRRDRAPPGQAGRLQPGARHRAQDGHQVRPRRDRPVRRQGRAAPLSEGPLQKRRERETAIAKLEKEMREASKRLEFEYAAVLRDRIIELRGHG